MANYSPAIEDITHIMLRLPVFEYFAPHTLDEAVSLLAEHGPDAMLVAGGTDLYPAMKRRLFTPKKVVGLRRIASLQTIVAHGPEDDATTNGEGLSIGAGVTLSTLATDPRIQQAYPALVAAVAAISTPQLRAMGTIGGNLCLDTRCTYYNQSEEWRAALGYCMKLKGDTCWVAPGSRRCLAVQSADSVPMLIALGARVQLVGPDGARWLPVAALYQNDGIDFLQKQPNEILSEIQIPLHQGMGQSYQKLRRRGSFDFPILSVAATVQLAEDGTCTDAKIVLGAVASSPLIAHEAQSMLIGQRLNDELIEAAAQQAYKVAKPLGNTDMTISYRKQMARVYVARALKAALAQRRVTM